MGRITRQVMFMDMARAASRRSTCFRLNVGAMVVHNNNPVSVGWNGQQAGEAHCAGNECAGIVPGRCGTIHAEVNALKKAADILEAGSLVDLYVTHSPCHRCLDEIVSNRQPVRRIFFETPYRNLLHLNNLKGPYGATAFVGTRTTEVYEVTPAGYVIEYFSRKVVELP